MSADVSTVSPASAMTLVTRPGDTPRRTALLDSHAAAPQARARRGKRVEHDTATDGGDGRERAQHEPVSAPRHQGSFEHEAREAPLARSDRNRLYRAGQDLGGAEVHAHARPRGERLAGRGQKL